MRQTGAIESLRHSLHQRAKIARHPEHIGGRDFVTAAAQQSRRDDGKIAGARLFQTRGNPGEIAQPQTVLDFGQRAQCEQQAETFPADAELASPRMRFIFNLK